MARTPNKADPAKTAINAWLAEFQIGVRISIDRGGDSVVDQLTADLLAALSRQGSISGAARQAGVSYRHAWLTLAAANETAGHPLFAAVTGGKRGGGAALTPHGEKVLEFYQRTRRELGAAAARSVPRIAKGSGANSTVLHVASAISLQEALSQAIEQYALERPSVQVRTMFGASNELSEQIAGGAHADVFLSAGSRHVQELARKRLVFEETRRALARNGLVVVGAPRFAELVRRPSDIVDRFAGAIIVADPACPLGDCTAKYLRDQKLTRRLRERLVPVENSRAVVSSIRSAENRLGIIFESDLTNATGASPLLHIPLKEVAAQYEGAVTANSLAPEEAARLLDYLLSDGGKKCFRRCGFAT